MSKYFTFVKGNRNEGAIDSIKRLNLFVESYLKENEEQYKMKEEDEYFDEVQDLYAYEVKPIFTKNVSKSDILETEERININFPKSYTDFILENGLFKWGSGDCEFLHPSKIIKLEDVLREEFSFDINDPKNENHKEKIESLICFSHGDEGRQSIYFYCFDQLTLNKSTGEMSVVKFRQDEWFNDLINNRKTKKCEGKGLDYFLYDYCNEFITKVLEY